MNQPEHGLPVVLGREDVAHYMARREPSYRVGRWMAGNLPAGARVVGQDHRGYYLPRPYPMELAHRRLLKWIEGRGEVPVSSCILPSGTRPEEKRQND